MKKNENILLRLHTKEARAGITRTDVDCVLGKICKLVYIISFIYAVAIKFLYSLSTYMQAKSVVDRIGFENLSALQKSQCNEAKNSIILVAVMTLLLIAGLVTLIKRLYIPTLILNTLPCVLLSIHFAERMSGTIEQFGIFTTYSYYHLIPLTLLFVSALIYCIIGLIFTASENKAYTAFVDQLYEQYSDKFENLSDEEWEAFLDEYDPKTKKKK